MKIVFPKSKLEELQELLDINPDARAVVVSSAEYCTILDELISKESALTVLLSQMKTFKHNGKSYTILIKEIK